MSDPGPPPPGRAAPAPRPLRLLFVATNRGVGGTESHAVSLATAMADAGHTVAAVAAPDDVVWRALAADGRVALYPGEFRSKWDRRGWAAVRAAVRAARPDWMLASFKQEYWAASVLGRLFGVRVAVFRHIAELKAPMAYGMARLADRFVVPSAFLRDWVVAHGVPAARVRVLHNPIDAAGLAAAPARRAAARAAFGFAPDEVVVGYVGRLQANKGVLVLVDALARAAERMPALRALWVGHGPDEAAVDAAVRASGGRQVRRPWTDDVAGAYAACDLLVLPSLWEEVFGRVLAEAQAAGVPVVASRVGGTAETMRPGESGLLVPRGDAGALADAIVALAADPERRSRMGAAGRAYARATFDAPVVAAACARMLAEER